MDDGIDQLIVHSGTADTEEVADGRALAGRRGLRFGGRDPTGGTHTAMVTESALVPSTTLSSQFTSQALCDLRFVISLAQ